MGVKAYNAIMPTVASVLITGCAGFIGSNLARRCLAEGWQVDGVDDLSNGHVEFVPNEISELIKGDFACDEVKNRLSSGLYDVVFHLAAVPRVGYSVDHPIESNDVNVSRTLQLLDACKGNVDRVVFASSSSVYGGRSAGQFASHENDSRLPKSPYALQKAIIEDYLRLYKELYGMDSVCLRFFNVFGPNQLGNSPYATAVSSWMHAIKSGLPMRSDGDGEQTRDMCYVDNVTDACVKAANVPKFTNFLDGRPFNVACGKAVSNNRILDSLIKRYPNASVTHAPERPGDVKHTLADVSRAKQELGYAPIVDFWEGLERTIEWVERTPEFTSLVLNK